MQEQHDVRELDEPKAEKAAKALKLDPNGLEYAQGALKCLKTQLETACGDKRKLKLGAGILRWERTVEKLTNG